MFLWGRVPDSTPVDELVRRAREKSILLAKGSLFSPVKGCGQCLRFNVAHSASAPLVRFLSDAIHAAAN
jgi:DNA-binding transcriptional MocR family regulator